jgi:hypothetical protein
MYPDPEKLESKGVSRGDAEGAESKEFGHGNIGLTSDKVGGEQKGRNLLKG